LDLEHDNKTYRSREAWKYLIKFNKYLIAQQITWQANQQHIRTRINFISLGGDGEINAKNISQPNTNTCLIYLQEQCSTQHKPPPTCIIEEVSLLQLRKFKV